MKHIQLPRRKNSGKGRIVSTICRLIWILDLTYPEQNFCSFFTPTPDTHEVSSISVDNTNTDPVGQGKVLGIIHMSFFPYPPQFSPSADLVSSTSRTKSELDHFSICTTTFPIQAISITCLDSSQEDPCILLQSILHRAAF